MKKLGEDLQAKADHAATTQKHALKDESNVEKLIANQKKALTKAIAAEKAEKLRIEKEVEQELQVRMAAIEKEERAKL